MKKKQAIKDILYGSMVEMMNNKSFFYKSSVGLKYSNWTDDGKKELEELLSSITLDILEAEEELVKDKAKEMFIEKLKG